MNIDIGNAAFFVKNDDGEYEKVGDWNDIQTLTESPEDATEYSKATVWGTIPVSRECSFTLKLSQKTRRKLINTFYWGWRAKGPVRMRMLKRAFWLGSQKLWFTEPRVLKRLCRRFKRRYHSKC